MATIDQCLQTFARCINTVQPRKGTSGYAPEGQMFNGMISGDKEWTLIMILLFLAMSLWIIVKKM
jgi:hypothetical protein